MYMQSFNKLLFMVTACLSTTLASCQNEQLLCNYATADISTIPGEHVVLAGFAARKGLSTEIHQPLKTHCLVIAKGTEKLCIISNDLMEISPREADRMRNEIANRTEMPVSHVLMHCTHTHSAPRTGGKSTLEDGTNYNYAVRTLQTIIDCAVHTILNQKAFQPFHLEVGKGTTSINGNRCEKYGPVDHDVYVARFVGNRNKPIVSIINVACHPVCMGPASLYLSPDYPGIAAEELRTVWGGDVIQLSGASGNMNPILGPKKVDYAEQAGHSLADSLKNISFTRIKERNTLCIASGVAELPFRIDSITPSAIRAHANEIAAWKASVSQTWERDVRGWEQEILDRFEEAEVPNKLIVNMAAVNIDGVLFFFTQGEPFVEYQLATRAAFPDQTIFFAGYTNGQNSYLPSAHAFEHKIGYKYELDQMHVYIKAPYPLSDLMPASYTKAINTTIEKALTK